MRHACREVSHAQHCQGNNAIGSSALSLLFLAGFTDVERVHTCEQDCKELRYNVLPGQLTQQHMIVQLQLHAVQHQ